MITIAADGTKEVTPPLSDADATRLQAELDKLGGP